MFLLNLIPEWLTYLLSGISFLGLVLGVLIPIPAHYKMALYSGLGMLLCLNSFAIGVSVNEANWQVKVKDMQIQIAQLETKTAEVTTKVVTEYIEKVKIVEGKTHVIIKKVPEYITKESDAKCSINTGAIELLNAAAENKVPESSRTSHEGPSDVKLSTLVESVSGNYGTYYQVVEQLKSLQDWIRKQKDLNNE
jgi:hypothetical protein